MKNFIIILLVIFSLNIQAQDSIPRYSFFLNYGQAVPLGEYRADPKSTNPFDNGRAKPFLKSFNLGLDCYIYKQLGITFGFSNYGLVPVKSIFEAINSDNKLQNTDSYLPDHVNRKIYVGIITNLIFKRIIIEPRFQIGYTLFSFEDPDFYQKNNEGFIYKTINFENTSSNQNSYDLALNLSYCFFHYNDLFARVQFFSELSFQQINFNYKRIESNKLANTITFENFENKQNIILIYNGIGFMFSF